MHNSSSTSVVSMVTCLLSDPTTQHITKGSKMGKGEIYVFRNHSRTGPIIFLMAELLNTSPEQ